MLQARLVNKYMYYTLAQVHAYKHNLVHKIVWYSICQFMTPKSSFFEGMMSSQCTFTRGFFCLYVLLFSNIIPFKYSCTKMYDCKLPNKPH